MAKLLSNFEKFENVNDKIRRNNKMCRFWANFQYISKEFVEILEKLILRKPNKISSYF